MDIENIDQIKNKEDRELIELLQGLVNIPSWVPDDEEGKKTQNEVKLIDFLENWLVINTDLKVTRQALDYGRFNLIAAKGRPDIIFLAHVDTVAPPVNSPYSPLGGEIHDGKVWGRGSSDMKCGIASLLQAFSLNPMADNYWAFFYADEEYDFLGMKAIVRDFSDLKPKYIISADGTDLKIGYGCRGLIEIRAQIEGITSHATSNKGKNAILGVYSCVNELSNFLENSKHPVMGTSSLNLAYIFGGKTLGVDGFDEIGKLKAVGQEGNVVSDIAEFVIDIRPSSPEISVEKIVSILNESLERRGLKLKDVKVRHNLGAWFTDLSEIFEYAEIAQEVIGLKDVKLSDPKKGGYVDIQMFWSALGQPPAFVFGGGTGSKEHADDESVEIDNVIATRNFFVKVLENQK